MDRPNKPKPKITARTHHTIIYYAALLIVVGLFINFSISLWEGPDIAFFASNTVFTVVSILLVIFGLVSVQTKNMQMFLIFIGLGWANLFCSVPPIVMYTNEGNTCGGLSVIEQEIGRDCYLAATSNDVSLDGTPTMFSNLVTLVTTCYSNNNILTSSGGVCYNIRWSQSTSSTLRTFMLITWLCQFFGTLLSIVCAGLHIFEFWELELYETQMSAYVQMLTIATAEQHEIFFKDKIKNVAQANLWFEEYIKDLKIISDKALKLRENK